MTIYKQSSGKLAKILIVIFLIFLVFSFFPYGLLISAGIFLFKNRKNFSNLWFNIFYFICLSGFWIGFPYGFLIGIVVFFFRKHLEQKERRVFQKTETKKAEKKQLTNSKLSELEVDYLKAFIERVGLFHFAALDLITKIPILEEKLELGEINMFLSETKARLNEIEKNIWKDQESLSPLKDALESLVAVVEELPKLQHLLENKGLVLSYSELVDLLKIKHSEMSEALTGPSKENLYGAIKKMTFILLTRAGHKKTKENIARAFATSINALSKEKPDAVDKALRMLPNLLTQFLNRLLKESKIIQDYLSQNEIDDLLNNKLKEAEADSFEAELKNGAKPTMVFPSNFNTLSGYDFESFLEKLFKGLGYSVVKTPLTGDQGADLIIEKGNERIAVQAKRYSGLVSNKAVQEVVAAVSYYKCNRAIVVATSTYTKSALKLAIPNKVELWDNKRLKEVINTLK